MAATQMKLFGKTIYFPETKTTHVDSAVSDDHEKEKKQSLCFEDSLCSSSVSDEDNKNPHESEFTSENCSSNPIEEGSKNSTSSENPETPSFETETDLQKGLKNKHNESNSENTPKKPDKLLPCPRCDSAYTKFCYYNNYNLTQPRYFCRNCQRYWTSGGTMRNVPVGSGRRKNKNAFDSHYCQIMVPESFESSQAYGKVLNFGANAHKYPCESFVSKPNFSEETQNCFQSRFFVPERKEFSSRENGDDRSSITSSDSNEIREKNNSINQEAVIQNFQNFSSMMFYQSPRVWSFPCFYQNPDSKILGKRSREQETLLNLDGNNLWYSKASRIDDPSKASKTSTWPTLDTNNEKSHIIKGKVSFKAFESNENDEKFIGDYSLMLQANPAAFARSLNFHEIA